MDLTKIKLSEENAVFLRDAILKSMHVDDELRIALVNLIFGLWCKDFPKEDLIEKIDQYTQAIPKELLEKSSLQFESLKASLTESFTEDSLEDFDAKGLIIPLGIIVSIIQIEYVEPLKAENHKEFYKDLTINVENKEFEASLPPTTSKELYDNLISLKKNDQQAILGTLEIESKTYDALYQCLKQNDKESFLTILSEAHVGTVRASKWANAARRFNVIYEDEAFPIMNGLAFNYIYPESTSLAEHAIEGKQVSADELSTFYIEAMTLIKSSTLYYIENALVVPRIGIKLEKVLSHMLPLLEPFTAFDFKERMENSGVDVKYINTEIPSSDAIEEVEEMQQVEVQSTTANVDDQTDSSYHRLPGDSEERRLSAIEEQLSLSKVPTNISSEEIEAFCKLVAMNTCPNDARAIKHFFWNIPNNELHIDSPIKWKSTKVMFVAYLHYAYKDDDLPNGTVEIVKKRFEFKKQPMNIEGYNKSKYEKYYKDIEKRLKLLIGTSLKDEFNNFL